MGAPFKGRAKLLETIFEAMPARLARECVKLYSNELPSELVTVAVRREMKFSELLLCNLSCEYSDKMDSLFKQTRSLRIFKSSFRQIFPRPMTNETRNEIEVLQLEDVDFKVQNTLFKACDRLQALSLCRTALKAA